MNKNEIIANIHIAHTQFWKTASHLPNVHKSANDKWSVAQNVEHINISLSRVSNYLALSKSIIESNFGLSLRASISNEELIENYYKAMGNGIKAPPAFIPKANSEIKISMLITEGENSLKDCIFNLEKWGEEDLDKYNCPHPVFGKITAREILYFTIFHVQHHHKTIANHTDASQ
ncbi:DinB family protein [Pedobacter sp. SD-b]|uniref:DinB family protein n=1 Tax=Pedobacter segetis TaxID=2793069 RepID=A0ABS1BG12_9SPHI|nr:DinB family protein [Pedobacter segetis]MBK0381760.1 DinB family protein [Pedobacter segetis]